LIIIFILAFPAAACAKHYGPLWAVWTHSEDPEECAIKTAFWMAVIAGAIYAGSKIIDDDGFDFGERFTFAPRIWFERDGEVKTAIEFTIRW